MDLVTSISSVWVSNDGSEFKMVDELTHDIPLSKEESLTYEFKSDFKTLKARYIKVLALIW